jgi:hypothetical protein
MADMDPARTPDSADAEQVSRLKRYDNRVEEWLASLKEGAGQRSPEVLGALAAKAKDVAEYLDKMAEQARSRRATDDAVPSLPTKDASASIGSPSEEPGSSVT